MQGHQRLVGQRLVQTRQQRRRARGDIGLSEGHLVVVGVKYSRDPMGLGALVEGPHVVADRERL